MENNTNNLITDIIEENGNNINSLVGEQIQAFATSTQFKLVNSDNLSKFASLFNDKIKADVDAKLAGYVTNSALSSKDYATKSEVSTAASNAENNAVASAQSYTDNKLKDYVTNTALTNKGYATESYADSAASTAQEAAQSAAKSYTDTQLTNYVTNTALTNKGYATKAEMEEGDAATLSSSKGYTDNKLKDYVTTTVLNNKGYATTSYVDSAASAAQTNATNAAKTYTDTEVGKAKTYAEGQASAAQSAAEAYTDTEVGKAKSYTDDEIEAYAETVTADITAAKNAAISAAKTETTNQVSAAKTELNTAISTGDSTTLASANAYTDTEVGKAKEYADGILDTAKEYAEEQASAAQSAAQTFTTNQLKNYVTTTALNNKGYATTSYADGKAAAAETNAKSYTDTEIGKAKTYAEEQASAAQSAAEAYTDTEVGTAKEYTDTEVGKAKTYAEEQASAAQTAAQTFTTNQLKNYVTTTVLNGKGYATTTYVDGKATSAETNAKSYTDTEVGKAKEYAEEQASAAQTAAQTYTTEQLKNYVTTTVLNSKGYATTSYADGKAAAAETNAKSYTDTEIGKAKTYAEEQASAAQEAAQSYTDTQLEDYVTTTVLNGKGYATTTYVDGKAAAAETNAKNYTDTAKTALNKTITDGDAATLASAKSYTDTKIGDMGTSVDGKIEDAVDDAVSSAGSYTDTEIGKLQTALEKKISDGDSATLSSAKSYADTSINTAKTALNKTITDGDSATLSSAKSYADTSINTAKTALNKTISDGDSATLTSAKSYTDTQLSSHTTTMNTKITNAQSAATSAANSYTDTALANLIDSAPEAMNTLGELATAIKNNKDTFDGYVAGIANEYLKLSGGTMTGSINFTSTSHGIKNSGNMILRNNSTATVLSSVNDKMYFRPKGDSDSTVEVTIDTNGKVTAPKFSGIFEGNASSADSAGKVGNSLKIQLNGGTAEGTSQFTFNGSAAKTVNITPDGIGAAKSDHGTHVTYSTTAPKANGTAATGSANNVARGDHVHPLQTTVSGNAGTATKLQTARTISLTGDVSGSGSFDGSANLSITTTVADDSHSHSSIKQEKLNGKTISLDTLTLSAGGELVKYYVCTTDGDGDNITGRPDNNNKKAFNLKVELIRWASSTDYITKQTYVRGSEKVTWHRYCTNGTWSAWEYVYTSSQKPTAANIGAAPTSHASTATTYGVSSASNYGHAMASSTTPKANGTAAVGSETAKFARGDHVHPLQTTVSGNAGSANKVNNNLVIKLNGGTTEGTNLFTFNGSAAKTINITPSGIGAAASSHGTHVTWGGTGSATTVARSDHYHISDSEVTTALTNAFGASYIPS